MSAQTGLSSFLVREGFVSAERMAEAIERSALYRVRLDTALLELRALDERGAGEALGRLTGYPVATPSLLGHAGAPAAVFPREWAETLEVAPCRVDEGEIHLVACGPVDPRRLEELESCLGAVLQLHAAPQFRVREAFARVYGGALPERFRRLVARFGPSPGPTSAPAAEAAPAVAPEPSLEPPASLPAALAADEPPPAGAARPAEPAPAPGPVPAPAAAPPDAIPSPRSRAVAALAAFLEGSPRRDEILGAVQRFLESRFVHGQAFIVARGWVSPAGARRPRISLDQPSVLTNVASGGIPFRGPVPRGNHALFAALGRLQPRELVLAPVLVGDRVVCVLWGDQGPDPLGVAADELLESVPFAERALARLVAQRRGDLPEVGQ
jgi:hypothetical protein